VSLGEIGLFGCEYNQNCYRIVRILFALLLRICGSVVPNLGDDVKIGTEDNTRIDTSLSNV